MVMVSMANFTASQYLFKITAKGQYWPLTCITNHKTMSSMCVVNIRTKNGDTNLYCRHISHMKGLGPHKFITSSLHFSTVIGVRK